MISQIIKRNQVKINSQERNFFLSLLILGKQNLYVIMKTIKNKSINQKFRKLKSRHVSIKTDNCIKIIQYK